MAAYTAIWSSIIMYKFSKLVVRNVSKTTKESLAVQFRALYSLFVVCKDVYHCFHLYIHIIVASDKTSEDAAKNISTFGQISRLIINILLILYNPNKKSLESEFLLSQPQLIQSVNPKSELTNQHSVCGRNCPILMSHVLILSGDHIKNFRKLRNLKCHKP